MTVSQDGEFRWRANRVKWRPDLAGMPQARNIPYWTSHIDPNSSFRARVNAKCDSETSLAFWIRLIKSRTMPAITLRPPTFSTAKQPSDHRNPTIKWLAEEWHVTHSTLPMWKNKRNVRIKYTPLEPSVSSIPKDNTDRLDDLVSYQSLKSDKVSTISGIDKVSGTGDSRGEWDWRGKGWLKIAGSHWEVMGWGEEEGTHNKWLVTMFAKTLFTPAGIDVYSQTSSGLHPATLEGIREALSAIGDQEVRRMSREIFEITTDDTRTD